MCFSVTGGLILAVLPFLVNLFDRVRIIVFVVFFLQISSGFAIVIFGNPKRCVNYGINKSNTHSNRRNHGGACYQFNRSNRCTVILCPAGATAGVDVRGAHPGTRETEALRPGRLVQKAHAVLLTGGSAFGFDAAGGVVQYLEEKNVGFPAGPVRVPIVPAAVIFDLGVGDASIRPDREMGYQACLNATDEPVAMGAVGAGTGATVGKAPGVTSSPGGVGSACMRLDSGLIVAAITVVNALGNVVHQGRVRFSRVEKKTVIS